MSTPIELSPEALEAFRVKARKVHGLRAIRFGVAGGACNGMQYVIEFDYEEKPRRFDIEWNPKGWDEHARGETGIYRVEFRVDKKSLLLLSGSRVTWTKTLMREGFNFENPNEASRCGCGHSFSAK